MGAIPTIWHVFIFNYLVSEAPEVKEKLKPRIRVMSADVRQISERKLLIPSRHIKLLDTVGQGKCSLPFFLSPSPTSLHNSPLPLFLFFPSSVLPLTFPHLSPLVVFSPGEFGVVYRGHLTGWKGKTEIVAVKTLRSKHMHNCK